MKKIYHFSMTVDEVEKREIEEKLKDCFTVYPHFYQVRRWGTGILIVMGFIIFIVSLMVSGFLLGTYRDGQVDALSGRIGYHLVTKPDSSKLWEKK